MLHGISELTYNCQGYIFWKGIEVEHYNRPTDEEMAPKAEKLADRCRHLEAIGVPVRTGTAIWHWEWFESMTADHPYKQLLSRTPHLYEHEDGKQFAVILNLVAYHFDGDQWHRHERDAERLPDGLQDEWDWKDHGWSGHKIEALEDRGFLWAQAGQLKTTGICFAHLEGINALLERYNVPADLLAND